MHPRLSSCMCCVCYMPCLPRARDRCQRLGIYYRGSSRVSAVLQQPPNLLPVEECGFVLLSTVAQKVMYAKPPTESHGMRVQAPQARTGQGIPSYAPSMLCDGGHARIVELGVVTDMTISPTKSSLCYSVLSKKPKISPRCTKVHRWE